MSDEDTEFVERYRALVEHIVHSIEAQLGIVRSRDDLIAFGMVGLLEARKRYDPALGAQFNTFAYYRIRGAVLDGVSQMSRVPRSVVRRSKALALLDVETEHAAAAQSNLPSTVDMQAMALDAVGTLLSRVATSYTLAVMTAPEHADPEAELSRRQSYAAITEATESLPTRERVVVRGHYIEERQFDDIAKELGVSKSWMSRIHAKALDRLRAALTGEPPPDDDQGVG